MAHRTVVDREGHLIIAMATSGCLSSSVRPGATMGWGLATISEIMRSRVSGRPRSIVLEIDPEDYGAFQELL